MLHICMQYICNHFFVSFFCGYGRLIFSSACLTPHSSSGSRGFTHSLVGGNFQCIAHNFLVNLAPTNKWSSRYFMDCFYGIYHKVRKVYLLAWDEHFFFSNSLVTSFVFPLHRGANIFSSLLQPIQHHSCFHIPCFGCRYAVGKFGRVCKCPSALLLATILWNFRVGNDEQESLLVPLAGG